MRLPWVFGDVPCKMPIMRSILFVVAAAMILSGCSAGAQPPAGQNPFTADSRYDLKLPTGWEHHDFGLPTVAIGGINKNRGEYVELIAEDPAQYTDSLVEYAEAKRNTMALSLDNPRMLPGHRVTFAGYPGVQYVIHGTLPDTQVEVGYVLTVLKTKDRLIQIITWAPEKYFEADFADLRQLPAGFSEKQPAASQP